MSQKHKELPNILYFFENVICKIPHGSGNCQGLSDWVVKFARERNLQVSQDEKKNVIVIAPATPGCENGQPVILQAHLDMVAVSENDLFDMTTHVIETAIKDGWMKANKTSLGADDGMGVAMMLYILDNDSIKHPELVCIFTVDEEIGCIGAEALDLSHIPFCPFGINLDWEDPNICFGSAGAKQVTARKKLLFNDVKGGNIITLSITGLEGGHSALAIDKGGANAIKVVVDALVNVSQPYFLSSINGGPKMNSIPTECTAVICADPENTEQLVQCLENYFNSVTEQYSGTDPKMQCGIVVDENQCTRCISVNDTTKIVEYLHTLPTGVIAMDCNLENTLETSLNMGVVKITETEMIIEFLVRSSIDSEAERISDMLQEISATYDAETSVDFTIQAWEPNWNYPLLDLCKRAHKEVTGREPQLTFTHGGLECSGLIKKLPGSQWVSIGATILKPHTVDERVDLNSVEEKFAVLCYMLENLA